MEYAKTLQSGGSAALVGSICRHAFNEEFAGWLRLSAYAV